MQSTPFGKYVATILRLMCLGLFFTQAIGADNIRLDESISQAILDRTNAARKAQGLAPLKIHSALIQAAGSHSVEMHKLDYFSHTSPTAGTRKVRDRIQKAGLTPKRTAENIFNCYGYPPEEVAEFCFQSWMESSGHRRNILDSGASHIGIGVAFKGDKVYVTQVFAGGGLNFEAAYVAPDAPVTAESMSSLATEVVELANFNRREQGKPPLQMDPVLTKAAVSHAKEMLEMNYFSHTSPVAGRTKVRNRVNLVGGDPIRLAENIYQCHGFRRETVPAKAIDSWIKSPGHRANLMDERLNKIGVGVVTKNGVFYVTQVFSGDR